MGVILDALQSVTDDCNAALSAAGQPESAVLDARDLELPGVWVTPGTIGFDYLGAARVAFAVECWIVSRDIGSADAVTALEEILFALRSRLPIGDVTSLSVLLPNHGADPLPALQFTINTEIS